MAFHVIKNHLDKMYSEALVQAASLTLILLASLTLYTQQLNPLTPVVSKSYLVSP